MRGSFILFLSMILFLCSKTLTAGDEIETLDQLLDSLKTIMEEEHIPGLMLSIVDKDSILFAGGLGYADLEKEVPVSGLHLFRLGSVTKTFAALSLIKMEKEGLIDLDETLARVAPDVQFENPWEETNPVTIRHILEHTAGFDDLRISRFYNRDGRELTAFELVGNMQPSLHCRWKPGEAFSYSNPGYIIATYLIEKLSGQSYKDYIRNTWFLPLGMVNSHLETFIENNHNQVNGYAYRGRKYIKIGFHPYNIGLAGCLSSTAEDMARYLQFYLNNGIAGIDTILAKEDFNYMETPSTSLTARKGLTNGYGLAIVTDNHEGNVLFRGHTGGVDGFASRFNYNRDIGIGYAFSMNNDRGKRYRIENPIRTFLTRDLPRQERIEADITPEEIRKFTGYYKLAGPRFQTFAPIGILTGGTRILLRDNSLYSKTIFTEPVKLTPAGNSIFFSGNENFPTRILFVMEDRSRALGIGGTLYTKSSLIWVLILRIFLFTSLAIMATLIPVGPVWVISTLLKRMNNVAFRTALLPFLAMLMMVLVILGMLLAGMDMYGNTEISKVSIMVYLGTYLFGILSLWTLIKSFIRSGIKNRFLKIYLRICGLALTFITVYLSLAGFMGLQLWKL